MRAARGRCPSSAHHCSAQHFPSLPLTSQAKMRSVSCRALGVYMCACPVSRLRETDTQCCAGLEMPTSKYCRCADDCGHEATCCKRLNAAGQGQKRALNNDTHCGGCQGLPPRNRQKTNAAAAGGGGGGGEGGGGGTGAVGSPSAGSAGVGRHRRGSARDAVRPRCGGKVGKLQDT